MCGELRENNRVPEQNVMGEVLWPSHGSSIILVSFTDNGLGTWLCLSAKKG